jgi:hypothetical protein
MPKRPRDVGEVLQQNTAITELQTARGRSITHPRPIHERERNLIALYRNCPLGMTPQQFYAKWQVTQQDIAIICFRSIHTVQGWFSRGGNYRHPTPNDLRHLALMDFILEHFEEIPKPLFEML